MASSINASTSGAGGVITTADASGNLNIQSGGSTVLALTSSGVAITGTLSATSITGAGGMTLLGTVNATSGNSVSLGSLNLTGYKELHIATSGISHSSTNNYCYVSSDNSQTVNYIAIYNRNAQTNSGILIINLATGSFFGSTSMDTDPSNNFPTAGKTNITTSTTTIYFRMASTDTFTAGSFLVYGVA